MSDALIHLDDRKTNTTISFEIPHTTPMPAKIVAPDDIPEWCRVFAMEKLDPKGRRGKITFTMYDISFGAYRYDNEPVDQSQEIYDLHDLYKLP